MSTNFVLGQHMLQSCNKLYPVSEYNLYPLTGLLHVNAHKYY